MSCTEKAYEVMKNLGNILVMRKENGQASGTCIECRAPADAELYWCDTQSLPPEKSRHTQSAIDDGPGDLRLQFTTFEESCCTKHLERVVEDIHHNYTLEYGLYIKTWD